MLKVFVLSILCICLSSNFANAQSSSGFFSGAYLAALCQSDASGKEIVKGGHATCQSYIAGIVDYHKLLQSLSSQPSIDFCVPNTEKPKNLQTVVMAYLKKHPEHAQFIAAPSVSLALSSAYPCQKKTRKKFKG